MGGWKEEIDARYCIYEGGKPECGQGSVLWLRIIDEIIMNFQTVDVDGEYGLLMEFEYEIVNLFHGSLTIFIHAYVSVSKFKSVL